MSQEHVRYLLIGNGVAASRAAAAIRQRDAEGSILLVTQDIHRPYNRAPLSKEFLRHQISRDALFTLAEQWFENQHVALRTGLRVARIDADRHSVSLESGDEIGFERLLLAIRARPRSLDVPGSQLPGWYSLRSIEDAIRLQTAVDQAHRDGHLHQLPDGTSAKGRRGRAAVIGGGLLGVETAASLAQLGVQVHLVLSESYPWPRFAGDAIGNAIASCLERNGVILHRANPAVALEGDGRVQRVRLADGSAVLCDFAVSAIGAAVDKTLLRGTRISAENAILTDEYCRTSVENIYAAGDSAAILDPLFGKHRIIHRLEHASIAGALAGRNMTGAEERYQGVNTFVSEAFGLALHGWGEGKLVARRLVRAPARSTAADPVAATPDLIEIGVGADNRVCQVLSLGQSAGQAIFEQLVARRVSVNGNAERFKDPAVPLAQLLL